MMREGRKLRPRSTVVLGCGLVCGLVLLGAGNPVEAASVAASAFSVKGGASAGPQSGTVIMARSTKMVFSGEAAVVEKALRFHIDAVNRRSVDEFLVNARRPGHPIATPADRKNLLEFMNAYRIVLYRITRIDVTGNKATIDYENAIVGRNLKSAVTTLLAQHENWVKDAKGWGSLDDVASAPGIPSDLAAVGVKLRDGAQIVLDALPAGEFAFRLTNSGRVPKQVFILGIPRALDVPSFIENVAKSTTPGFPEPVLEMGAANAVKPGDTGTMVFSGPLPRGRYLLLTQTPDGVNDATLYPHEYAEFTV